MTHTVEWLSNHVLHAQVTPPSQDGGFVVVTFRADGGMHDLPVAPGGDSTHSAPN